MNELRFGTAGIPISAQGKGTVEGVKQVRRLDLEAMELEFVRGVNVKEDMTVGIKRVAEENDITLTAHSPYWINLNSDDKKKFHASISYITNSAKIASLCGGWSVCFHSGYYMKQGPKKVYARIKEGIGKVLDEVKEFDKNIWIRPELTGKPSQFGDIDEVIKLSQDLEQVMPCVDFSHIHARDGRYNTYEEFAEILKKLETGLGGEALKNMHIHVSGIEYSEKGEKHHLILKESDLNYEDLIKVWKDFNIKGVVISESPNIENDAILMKKIYRG